jgi:N-carbamoylputrescine amidase
MSKIVKGGLIQATLAGSTEAPIEEIKKGMIEKHLGMIEQAANQGVQIMCLQELFYGPYFCAEQKTKWYGLVEKVPEGETTTLMMEIAAKYNMVIVVKISRQIPQASYPSLRTGILGEILFQAR